MVLTRSTNRQPSGQDSETNIGPSMENIPVTTAAATVANTNPVMSLATGTHTLTTTTGTMTPAVQQFMAMAREQDGSRDEFNITDSTIPSPVYSSITARNVRQEFRGRAQETQAPPPSGNTDMGSMIEFLRVEFARQMQEFQRTVQRDISQAMSQQVDQATGSRPAGETGYLGHNGRPTFAAPGIGGQTPGSHANVFPQMSSGNHIKLKDWKVSYSGEGSVTDFLFKIDTLTERSQCSLEFLLANFHIFLTNKAETWYWTYIKQTPNATYTMLKSALIGEFGTLETDHEILLKISTRKQLHKECYDDFHTALVQLNLRLRCPMPDLSLIEIIKRNVRPELKVMLFISDPRDLGELRSLARKAEKCLSESKASMITSSQQRHVNEVQLDHEESEEEERDPQVEALNLGRPFVKGDFSRIKCWNCLKMGHSYIYCPEEVRSIFCYKCGQRGVTTPKCKGPHSGNRGKSEMATGGTRSPT